MKRKKSIFALLSSIVLFAGAVAFALVFSPGTGADGNTSSPIVISEILASNRTYPAPNGQFLDFIEVHNTSDMPIDISGYMLGDQPDTVGYTFPKFSPSCLPMWEMPRPRASLRARAPHAAIFSATAGKPSA